jgi:hypothetical protein
VVQSVLHDPLLYADENEAFLRRNLDRWMGTFDHPLVLSLFLVVALFLLAGLRRWQAIAPLALLLLAGLTVTQSRVGLAVGVLGVVHTIVRVRMASAARLAMLALVGIGVLSALDAGLGGSVLSRLSDDQGSSEARAIASAYFFNHVGEYLWFGQGIDASFSVSQSAGLETSFESAIMMYTIDLGAAVTLVYFGTMLLIALRPRGRAHPRGVMAAALAAVFVPQSFSALSGNSAAPMTVWLALALAGFCAVGPRRVKLPPTVRRTAVPAGESRVLVPTS